MNGGNGWIQGGLSRPVRKGLNSIIVLGAWIIWKHHNRCVFDGASLNMAAAFLLAKEELFNWSLARARGISHLLALVQDGE